MAGSSLPGLYKRGRAERLAAVAAAAGLGERDAAALAGAGLDFETADSMIENAVGMMQTPLGVATNFVVNGRDVLVPMATEESSVVAAASKGAKAARASGGFEASAGAPVVTGQVQVVGGYAADSESRIAASEQRILDMANAQSSTLSAQRRGARSVSCRRVETRAGQMLLVELAVDAGEAMGANVTNTMCEAVAPIIAEITGGRTLLRILSNYSLTRVATARATFAASAIGEQAASDMLLAYELARSDVHRAVTHNKGIMNGVSAVAAATGQDVRAIEAAAHAHAARSGAYSSLSSWSRDDSGNLAASLEIPLAVGTVGGAARIHPVARACAAMAGGTAERLACVMAAAGLAQNYAAMLALVTRGIQEGHMRLHARNLALAAGAAPARAAEIAAQMIRERSVSAARARQILSGAR